MKNDKSLALVGLLLLTFLLSAVPAYAWTYPDLSEDFKYEKFGPRLDRIYISMYASEDAEWDAMELGHIDISDWPLSFDRYTKWTSPPYTDYLSTVSYGPELGFFLIDINNNNNPELAVPDPDPTVIDEPCPIDLPNPCADTAFRHALWHAMDRDYVIAEIWKGMGYPMYTVIVPALELAYPPGAELDIHPFDLTEANRILDEAGYLDADGDGWRERPDGTDFELIFYARADHEERRLLAEWFTGILETELHVPVDLRISDRRTCFFEVMVNKNFHLYTGGWLLGPEPDYFVLYHSDYYWHPGFCYNYDRVNCTAFDEATDHILMANTFDEAKEWVAEACVAFNDPTNPGSLGALFVVSSSGYKSWYKTYTGGSPTAPPAEEADYVGSSWTHLVNVPGYGPDSFFTFLNAHPEGFEYGLPDKPMTMRYGFKVLTMEKPSNPVYAEWVWDWAVLGLSYESLLARDPYTFEWMPWLCDSFEPFIWTDPETGEDKSGVRFVLRSDVYWSDGTPMTAVDVFWSLVEFDDALMDAGLAPPWWYSSTVFIRSFYILDPYTIEILLDIKSVWAIGWVGGAIILPKHIWKPLLDSYVTGTPYREDYVVTDFYAAYVDPDVICTGPYRFVEYVANDHTILVANKPGSVVETAWDYSVPVTSPGYWRYHACYPHIEVLAGKFDAGTYTFDVVIDNLCLTEDMSVDVTITIDGSEVAAATGVSIPAGTSYTESITHDFTYGKHTIEVTVDWSILGTSGTRTYTMIVSTAIMEDIGGKTYHDDIGLPDYPYKADLPTADGRVDIKDIATAARAFGAWPGHVRWNPIADIDHNYIVDIRDIAKIAMKFGWTP